MSRDHSPDASVQLDEGTALQRLQNGLELGLSISKPTASAHSAEILEAINNVADAWPCIITAADGSGWTRGRKGQGAGRARERERESQ